MYTSWRNLSNNVVDAELRPELTLDHGDHQSYVDEELRPPRGSDAALRQKDDR